MVDRSFSLTLALRAIAADADLHVSLDDLHALLGLSWMVPAVPSQVDPSGWSMYARDAFLLPAGLALGMTIRDVHPPEAARGLSGRAEFRQHFDASYRPLVLRALEHEQPVLAWQGWPGEDRLMWGIIKEAATDGVGFSGLTFSRPGVAEPGAIHTLASPPVQLYVVERIDATAPDAERLLHAALRHARCVLHGQLVERFGVLTGAAAVTHWGATLRTKRGDGPVSPGFARSHHQFVGGAIVGLLSAARFLRGLRPRLSGKAAEMIEPLATSCERITTALSSSANYAPVQAAMATAQGRDKLAEALRQAQTGFIDLMALVDSCLKDAE